MRWGGELFWGAWKKLEGFCSLAGVAGPTRPSISSQAGPGLPLHWAAASWPEFLPPDTALAALDERPHNSNLETRRRSLPPQGTCEVRAQPTAPPWNG